MMVEGSILLHQDDDVLYIVNRPLLIVRRDRERLGDVRVQRGRYGGHAHAHQLQELTPIGTAHVSTSFFFSTLCGSESRRQLALPNAHAAAAAYSDSEHCDGLKLGTRGCRPMTSP